MSLVTVTAQPARGPVLPSPRGPVSAAVVEMLRGAGTMPPSAALGASADPYGEDLQLSLYLCYELHYRSFDMVGDHLEWDPDLLAFRAVLERRFLAALRDEVPGGADIDGVLRSLLTEPAGGRGPSHHLAGDGERWQLREYVVHRSLYHLKEADPQSFVVPRLEGAAKAALVTVQHDEYGAGRAERLHSRLFAEMMAALDLDPAYGAYLDAVPAATLATVNAMSLFGLHRSLRGALVGQFAAVEITSSPGSARLARAAERLAGGTPAASAFYREHVEADAVHEQLVRSAVAALVTAEPHLAADVVFGVQASSMLEDRLADHLLSAWGRSQSSLLSPLPAD